MSTRWPASAHSESGLALPEASAALGVCSPLDPLSSIICGAAVPASDYTSHKALRVAGRSPARKLGRLFLGSGVSLGRWLSLGPKQAHTWWDVWSGGFFDTSQAPLRNRLSLQEDDILSMAGVALNYVSQSP